MADLNPAFGSELAEALRQQALSFKSQFNQQDLDELRRQADQWRDSFKAWTPQEFKVDPKAMEELRKQMEQFRQSFKADQFKVDPKQMEQLRRQMEEFRKSFPQNFKVDRPQFEQFHRQIKQLRDLTLGQTV
jgi:hypothetical protein